jgi:hypothetical protein
MVRRNVQQLEVQLVGLDLDRLVGDEAELSEDPNDLALRLDQRMKGAPRQGSAGQRDIGLLAGEPHLERDLVQPGATGADLAFELFADGVCERADLGSILTR